MLFICFCYAVVLTLLSLSKAIESLLFYKYVLWMLELELLQLDASSEWEVCTHYWS